MKPDEKPNEERPPDSNPPDDSGPETENVLRLLGAYQESPEEFDRAFDEMFPPEKKASE
jgi:hypothetical protein